MILTTIYIYIIFSIDNGITAKYIIIISTHIHVLEIFTFDCIGPHVNIHFEHETILIRIEIFIIIIYNNKSIS